MIVDAENVRRSRWPNLSPEELVARARAWAAERDVTPLMVFDGPAPEEAEDVMGTRGESADDRIAELAASLAAARQPYWLVTSDRGLRARAGGHAVETIGGGSFAGDLVQQS